MSINWEKYNSILGFELNEKIGGNPKEFFKNYKLNDTLTNENKKKIELLMSISKDIGNSKYEKGLKSMGSSKEAIKFFTRRIGFESVEHFEAMYLDKNYNVVKAERISTGLISQSLVDIRKMLKSCFEDRSIKYIVTAHNHPSGVTEASREDMQIQERIRELMPDVGVRYLDNVIVSYNGGKSIFTQKPYYREGHTNDIKIKETFINKEDAEKMVNRGDIENLSLEEKISVLTDLTPTKLKGIFVKKDITDIKLTKVAEQVLNTVKSFFDDIEKLYDVPHNATKVTSQDAVAKKFYYEEIPNNKVAVASLSTKCEILNITQIEENMMLAQNILEVAIKNAAYGVILVTKDSEKNYSDQHKEHDKVEKTLNRAGVKLFDYINFKDKSSCFSTVSGNDFTVTETKSTGVNEVQQDISKNNGIANSIGLKMRGLDFGM